MLAIVPDSLCDAKHARSHKLRKEVVQQFTDPRAEETGRVIDHAREVESVLRAESMVPPAYKGRETAHYGMISHEAHNPDVLRVYDTLQDERRDRYKNRYIVEHNFHAQDIKGDHINQVRQLNKVAPERFEESKRRGYDIIDNKVYGNGPKGKPFHESFPAKRRELAGGARVEPKLRKQSCASDGDFVILWGGYTQVLAGGGAERAVCHGRSKSPASSAAEQSSPQTGGQVLGNLLYPLTGEIRVLGNLLYPLTGEIRVLGNLLYPLTGEIRELTQY
ncbi:unnamed protein product [Polarella glacialis]|uniref:Uncharacterized protein n=1 Tax=Polarella glacialis TaxID=89957 RepID=A0A813DRK3_POLGL|nr:unnamed protein product [Polarella glacialis]